MDLLYNQVQNIIRVEDDEHDPKKEISDVIDKIIQVLTFSHRNIIINAAKHKNEFAFLGVYNKELMLGDYIIYDFLLPSEQVKTFYEEYDIKPVIEQLKDFFKPFVFVIEERENLFITKVLFTT